LPDFIELVKKMKLTVANISVLQESKPEPAACD